MLVDMAEFAKAMKATYTQAKDLGYPATDFKIMLDRYGPLETARKCVLKEDGVPSGVFSLLELGHPEISVEAVVVQFADLLANEGPLVAVARERLRWMERPEVQAKARELRKQLVSRSSR